jgi:hypothetical protein
MLVSSVAFLGLSQSPHTSLLQPGLTSCFVAGIFAMNCSYAAKPEIGLPFQTIREFGVYRLESVGRSLSQAV